MIRLILRVTLKQSSKLASPSQNTWVWIAMWRPSSKLSQSGLEKVSIKVKSMPVGCHWWVTSATWIKVITRTTTDIWTDKQKLKLLRQSYQKSNSHNQWYPHHRGPLDNSLSRTTRWRNQRVSKIELIFNRSQTKRLRIIWKAQELRMAWLTHIQRAQ